MIIFFKLITIGLCFFATNLFSMDQCDKTLHILTLKPCRKIKVSSSQKCELNIEKTPKDSVRSPDNKLLAQCVMELTGNGWGVGYRVTVKLFCGDKILYSKSYNDMNRKGFQKFIFSRDSRKMAVVFKESIDIIDVGNSCKEDIYTSKDFKNADFQSATFIDEKGDYIGLLFSNNKLSILKMEKGSTLFRLEFPANYHIEKGIWSSDNKIMILGKSTIFEKEKFYIWKNPVYNHKEKEAMGSSLLNASRAPFFDLKFFYKNKTN